MSMTLSIISRQLDSTTVVYQCQSVQSSLEAPSMRGTFTSGGGGLPSGSCHTNFCPNTMRVAVLEVPGKSQAVPASRKARWCRLGLDLPRRNGVRLCATHLYLPLKAWRRGQPAVPPLTVAAVV